MQFSPSLVLVFSTLSALRTVAAVDNRSEAKVFDSASVGGPHGTEFTDLPFVGQDHKRISKILMSGGCGTKWKERVSQLQLTYRDNFATSQTVMVNHGGTEGSLSTNSIDLAVDEYVTKVEMSAYKQRIRRFVDAYHTRVGYIKFTTSKQQIFECGDHKELEQIIAFDHPNHALLYFSGKHGAGLDLLQPHWIPSDEF